MKGFKAVQTDVTPGSEADASWQVMKEYADPGGSLTSQQERFVFLVASGVPAKAALAGAGYAKGTQAARVLGLAPVKNALAFVKEQEKDQIFVNRDKLTSMLFAAHAKSANATEEIAAIRELGKMHDVYAQAQEDRKNQLHTAVQINHNTVTKLSDDDLLKIAQMASSDITPALEDNRHATNFLEAEGITVEDGYNEPPEFEPTLEAGRGEEEKEIEKE